MKKSIFFLLFLIFFIHISALSTPAIDYENIDSIESDIKGELRSVIDDEVLDILEDIGLQDLNFDNVYNISFENITSFFSVTLKNRVEVCSKVFFELLSVVMLTGIITALFKDDSDNSLISVLSVIVVTLLTVNTISDTLSSVVSVLEMSGKFMLSFVPIYTLIISLSGNAASALTYNTLVMGLAEFISSVITSGATDLIGAFFCLSVSFSLNSSMNVNRFIAAVNRIVSTVLGLSASLFTGFLGIKNILSMSVDSLSVKGIRFLIGSLIPIVGSSISEAYSSLLGSINLIKGSTAVIGILVIIIINVPVIFETLAYYISFSVLGYVSDSVYAHQTGDVLRCFSCGIRILLLLCVFEMFILIITTGILLSVKNGG